MADGTVTDPLREFMAGATPASFDARPPIAVVVSPKGGTGKTMVAVNMAIALARRAPTVLVDLDVIAGDVEYALRSHPIHRLDDLVQKVNANQITDIEAMLTPHPTGVDALCAPESPIVADQLSPVDSFTAIDRLIDLRRPLVLDTGSGISAFTIGALDRATHVLLVSGTDVASVHAARKMIETMAKMAMDAGRIRLVINKANSRLGLAPSDVEEVLGLGASLTIPDLPVIAAAVNRGIPITESAPGIRVSRRFFAFADELVGLDAAASGRGLRHIIRRRRPTTHKETP